MRDRFLFNDNWLYAAETLDLDAADGAFEAVTLPHTNKLFPHHNFDNLDYQFISTYRKRFDFSAQAAGGRTLFLDFEGVMLACTVYLNGVRLAEHLGGYISFAVDLTETVQEGENVLTVYVDSRERKDIPPYGYLVDYLTFGGIYRDVFLRLVDPTHMENLFVRPTDVLTTPQLACDVRLNQIEPGLSLTAQLLDPAGQEIATAQATPDGTTTTLAFSPLPQVDLWDLDSPTLYTVRVALHRAGAEVDTLSARFGFRTAEFRQDGSFYLNGQRTPLIGLNRHQTYPYIGAAAPARLQRQDADIIKNELGCNLVRTSHYPQSPYFLDRCDEIGLLVFEEITGWQHVGDAAWQEITLAELGAMIDRDHNHPSIIMWGVRVNESRDNDDLYTRTNALARRMDPTRQTGGVRDFLGSSFLEDIYTFNDFSNTVREPTEQPHLITEFAGHMFPTKIFDHEERLIDHALLHTKVQNLQLGNDRVAGAIGWCAFDYNTHIEFGSGDRICYHGVMDIFRLPKWAAHFYGSQQSPTKRIVLQAATHWTMGDRSGGGNNPLTVFSNCDEVEIAIGDIAVGKFQPDRAAYPHLPHPPFTIRGLNEHSAWGQAKFYDLHLVGYLNGEAVAKQSIASSRLPKALTLSTDTDHLWADGADMTRLIVRITDEFGNPLPYAVKVVTLEVDGPAELIGENPFPLLGGQAALYVKSRHQPGTVTARARVSGLPEAVVSLEILAPQP